MSGVFLRKGQSRIVSPPRHDCQVPTPGIDGTSVEWRCPVCGLRWLVRYCGDLHSATGMGGDGRWRRREIRRLRREAGRR